MKRSAFISDLMFAFFTATIFTICLFRYLGIRLFLATALSILCGALTAASVGAFLQRKRKTLFLKRSDEAQKEKLLFHLSCLNDNAKTQFFLERLTEPEEEIVRAGKLRLQTDKAIYRLHFNFAPVTADEVISFSHLKTDKQKCILCGKIEDYAYDLAQRLQITIWTGNEVYAFLKDRDALPQSYLNEETLSDKRKRKLHLWFSRANAKRFLIAATLTLITALLSPFPYYYLICGTILLLCAVFIRIFGYE